MSRWLFGGTVPALLGLLALTGAASAQASGDELVALRAKLREPVGNFLKEAELKQRKTDVKALADVVRGPLQLKVAAGFAEWDQPVDSRGRDQAEDASTKYKNAFDVIKLHNGVIRDDLLTRLQKELRELLKSGDALGQQLALRVLAEGGSEARPGNPELSLAKDVVALLAANYPEATRAWAGKALMKVTLDLKETVASMKPLATSGDADTRVAYHKAINDQARNLTGLAMVGPFAKEVVPILSQATTDADPAVQRFALHSLFTISGTLTEQVQSNNRTDFLTFAALFKEAAAALAAAASSPDAENRLLAIRTLLNAAVSRFALYPAASELPATLGDFATKDQLGLTLIGLLPTIAEKMKDPVPRVRLAATEFCEALVAEAPSAVAPLVGALCDASPFVRWAAARGLGRAAPRQADEIVPALAKALEETDLDVRLTALTAIGRFGPAGHAAVTQLVAGLNTGDPLSRLAFIRTLAAVRASAAEAVGPLSQSLTNEDARVRAAAAEAIGVYGPAAASATAALQAIVNDADAEVRKAASYALLAVSR